VGLSVAGSARRYRGADLASRFCVEPATGNKLPLASAAELAVACGGPYVTATLLQLLLSPRIAVPRHCRNAPRPVPKLTLGCLAE